MSRLSDAKTYYEIISYVISHNTVADRQHNLDGLFATHEA